MRVQRPAPILLPQYCLINNSHLHRSITAPGATSRCRGRDSTLQHRVLAMRAVVQRVKSASVEVGGQWVLVSWHGKSCTQETNVPAIHAGRRRDSVQDWAGPVVPDRREEHRHSPGPGVHVRCMLLCCCMQSVSHQALRDHVAMQEQTYPELQNMAQRRDRQEGLGRERAVLLLKCIRARIQPSDALTQVLGAGGAARLRSIACERT